MASVIIDINLGSEDASRKAKELANSIKAIKEEQKALKKSGDENPASYAQNTQMLRTLQAEQKSYLQLAQAEIGSNNQLRAQLALVTQQYNALSKEERDNSLAGKAFQTQIRGISDELKKNESAVGDNRRNVGNYKDALKGAGSQLTALVPELGGAVEAFESLEGVLAVNVKGLGFLKAALVSTGIGAIIVLLGSLYAYFTSTEEGSEKLERGIAGLKGAFSAFITPLAKVGEFLVDLFTNPIKALKDFKSLLSGNLLDGVKNFGKSVKEGFDQGANIEGMVQKAEDAGRDLNKQASKLRADAAVLRAKGDAESLKQAESYLKKANGLTIQAVNAEIKAQQALIDQKKKLGQDRDADYDKLNELYGKIDQSRQTDAAKAEKIGARLEKIRIREEESRKKAIEESGKADAVRIESLNNTNNLILTAREKEFADINNDTDAKIILYKKYDKTVQQLELERAAKLAALRKKVQEEDLKTISENSRIIEDLTIARIENTGQRELATIAANGRRKLEDQDILISQTQEKVRLGEEGATEILRSQIAVRNEMAYNAELEVNQKIAELDSERIQRNYDNAARDIELQEEVFAAKERIRDQEEELLQSGTDLLAKVFGEHSGIYKAAFVAQKAFALSRIVIQTQEALAANRLGEQLANASLLGIPLIGIGLAAANSAKSAVQRAFILAGGVLAGATVAAQAVAGFNRGVIGFQSDGKGSMVRGKGTAKSDSINARLSNGESVINAKSTEMFAPLLSAINVAGGGRALAPGFAMASGGLAGSYPTTISTSVSNQMDIVNGVIAGIANLQIITDVRDITSAQQRNNSVVVNATI